MFDEGVPHIDADSSKAVPTKAKRARRSKWLFLIVGVTVLLIVALVGVYIYTHRSKGPLPESVVKTASFPLFYPYPLPEGYNYLNNSAKLTGGVLFYTIASGSQQVSITEQATPSNPPALSQLPGFTSIQTFAGNAAIGSSNGSPVGIILSNTTLIIINGGKHVPSIIVNDIVRSMNTLQEH